MMEMTEVCGVSGNRYALEVYPVWTQFKALAGVYMFFKPRSLSPSRCLLNQPLGIWDILYIGETEDFNRRLYQQLMEHHKYQYITQKGATHIALLALSGCKEEQRKWIESDLINYYIPSGNAQM